MYTRLFWAQFFLVGSIALFHALALHFAWYWHIWQLDTPVHIVGGLWVGLATLWLVRDYAGHTVLSYAEVFFVLMTVILIGCAWEVFEIYAFIIGNDISDLFDSIKDLCMDMIGGLISLALVRSRLL